MVKLSSFGKHLTSESTRMATMFSEVLSTDHSLCDVILRVPGSEADAWVSLGSNKVLLRMKSGVLDAMWKSDSSAKGVETIDIADCSELAIRALNAVAFGLFDAVEITTQNVAELLYAALKYDFKLVADCCQEFIEDVVAKGDAIQWLPIVSALHENRLEDYASKIAAKCGLFDSKNTTTAFECDAVSTLPFAFFRDLLKSDALEKSEEFIWQQCVKWAKHNSDECEETDDIKMTDCDFGDDSFLSTLRLLKAFIRFPQMRHEFFMKNVVCTGLLSSDEIVSVCKAACHLDGGSELFCPSLPRLAQTPSFDLFAAEHFEVRKKGATEVLRVTGDRRALFGCSKGWQTGVHKWRFTVDKCNGGCFGFGVSQNCEEYSRPHPSLYVDGGNATEGVTHPTYFFFGSKNHFRCQRGKHDELHRDWVEHKEGDTVELTLDCECWLLSAVHNGTTKRDHSLECNHIYYPVVASVKSKSRGLEQTTVEWLS